MRKSVVLDDPLRIQDMKVPSYLYARRPPAGGGSGAGPRKLTLGRFSNTPGPKVQLRRKTAVTSDADETYRLRSLSADEKRIMDRIRGKDVFGDKGNGLGVRGVCVSDGSSEGYQELCRNVRLTFTGNQAISCGNLAANQARAKRALDGARRPPAGAARQRHRQPASLRLLGDARNRRAPSAGKGRARRSGSGVRGTRERTKGGSCSESRGMQSSQSSSHNYSQETSIVKEMPTMSTETPEKCSSSSNSPSATAVKQLEKRMSSVDLRGANPQTMDTVATLSSWVHAGSALLRHISAARDGGASVSQAHQQQLLQLEQQQLQQQLQQQQLQLESDEWDPAEVNVNRLIRKRHLEALFSNSSGEQGLVEHLMD